MKLVSKVRRINKENLIYAVVFATIAVLSGQHVSDTALSSWLQDVLVVSCVIAAGLAAMFLYWSITERKK